MVKVLFLHFPIDNNQLESKILPDFFAEKGLEVYSFFEKGSRNFYSKHIGDNKNVINVGKDKIINMDYDIIISKSNSYRSYGKKYFNSSFLVNITPMHIPENTKGIDLCFMESEVIKPPTLEMSLKFKNYTPWNLREDRIIIPASIGGDKNQIGFLKLYEESFFKKYKLIFAGQIKNKSYFDNMKRILIDKKINYEYLGFLSREQLAAELSRSKLMVLTTDPRPVQVKDPGPRIVFESLCAGTPCLLNNLIDYHEKSAPYVFCYKEGNRESLELQINIIKNSNLEKISQNAYAMSRKFYNMNFACDQIFKKVFNVWKGKN